MLNLKENMLRKIHELQKSENKHVYQNKNNRHLQQGNKKFWEELMIAYKPSNASIYIVRAAIIKN
jgi:hypothetical protein